MRMIACWAVLFVCTLIMLPGYASIENPDRVLDTGKLKDQALFESPIIPVENVTIDAVKKVLEKLPEFKMVSDVTDERGNNRVIRVERANYRVFVILEPEIKAIRLIILHRLAIGMSREKKLEIANILNTHIPISRFMVIQGDDLCADFYLFYDEGLNPGQFLQSFRDFEQATAVGIRFIYDRKPTK